MVIMSEMPEHIAAPSCASGIAKKHQSTWDVGGLIHVGSVAFMKCVFPDLQLGVRSSLGMNVTVSGA